MESRNRGATLLAAINERFIEDVGPVGSILIDDTIQLWRSKRWHGPSAFRHYITNLAANIDNKTLKERFLHDAGRLLLNAQSKTEKQH